MNSTLVGSLMVEVIIMDSPMIMIGGRIENQTLSLGTGSGRDGFRDGVEIVNCTLRIGNPKRVHFFCVAFINTTIHMVNRCNNVYWHGSVFESCTFTGKYYGNVFGIRHELCSLNSGLKSCDFSTAGIHLCTFFNCTAQDIRFPKWPHFTVVHPCDHVDDWSSIRLGDSFVPIQKTVGNQDPRTVAITLHWPTLAKGKKDLVDAEQAREILGSKAYVVL
jgi:hypothetical protein